MQVHAWHMKVSDVSAEARLDPKKAGDRMLIDGLLVNGSAKLVGLISGVVRFAQSGFIYHYAFAMILGVLAMIITFITLK